jgi:glycosyltransferase involved in cell wall biosynthesis
MNLAIVNSSYRLGGAETVARDLYEECARAGHATRYYVAAGKTYPRQQGLVPLYPRVLSRLYHSRVSRVVDLTLPRWTWTNRQFRNLATGWPDVVHVHNFHGDYATIESLAHVARRKPLVWTFHAHWGITGGCDHPLECARFEETCGACPRLGVWPLRLVDDTSAQLQLKLRLLGDLPLHAVSPARYLAERIRRSRIGRRWQVHHIPNGVSTRVFSGARKHDAAFRQALGIDPDRVSILVVNRNFRDVQKGFDVVGDVLRALAPSDVPVQVVLAGESSEWAAAQVPADLRPVALGYVDSTTRMAALFEAADVMLFASPAETFPCVVLEAMAAECCVVATPTSGVTEQIEDGVTGLLADRATAPALACALRQVLADAHRRQAMGRAARQHVAREFSIERAVRRYLDLYEAAVTAGVTH